MAERAKSETGGGLPDKGTGTGVNDNYGADLSGGATNKINGQPKGDFMMPCEPGGGCNDGEC